MGSDERKHDDKSYRVIFGKSKDGDGSVEQAYRYPKDSWSEEAARSHCKDHDGSFEAAAEKTETFLHILTEKADPDAKIFPWSMPARYYTKPGRMIIYGTSLVAGQTRKGDIYSREEVLRGARGLIAGPIELFEHSWDVGEPRWLPYPDNIVLDGEEVNGHIEYIAGIEDPKVQELINNGEIVRVSVNAICRHVPPSNPGLCEGMILNGFCLLGKDAIPASTGTYVKIWNSFRARRLEEPSFTEASVNAASCSPESVGAKKMSERKKKPQQVEPTVAGPAAGVAMPSTEDRVTALEAEVAQIKESLTAVSAKLDTLIQATPAPTQPPAATPAPPAVLTGQKKKTQQNNGQEEGEQEKLRQAQKERAQKHGISPKEGGHLTKPDEYKNVPDDQFADPVNYRYPVDKEHAAAALKYFNQPDNRKAGGYSHEEAVKIMQRIIKACLVAEVEVAYQPEDAVYRDLPEELKSKLSGYEKKKTQQAGEPGESPPEKPPEEGQPKTDRERFMAHYELTEEQMDHVLEWIGEDIYKLLPERGQKIKTEQVIAAVKPVESEENLVVLTEKEIYDVMKDKRRFTPALQVNGILDLLEQKKKEAEA